VIPNAEYRRTASPQANRTGALPEVAKFPFPGIMWPEKQSKENKDEKLFRYGTPKQGKNSQQHHSL